MKLSKKVIQNGIGIFVMFMGILFGSSMSVNSQDPGNDCGVCDWEDGVNFCNFNYYGDCGGNDGGPCGSVSCGS